MRRKRPPRPSSDQLKAAPPRALAPSFPTEASPPSKPDAWEPMFKPLAQQGGLVLATVSTLGRGGLRALLSSLLTLMLVVAVCWLLSAPDSLSQIWSLSMLMLLGFLLAIVVLAWAHKHHLVLALNSQQVIGLRLTGDPSWFPPEALQRVASHVGQRTSEGVTSPYGHHVLQLGARTLTIDQSFLKASAASLEHPLERMFDDVWQDACEQAAKDSQQQARQPSLAAVLGPLRSLRRDFIEAPVLTFYTVPWRPLAVLWRAVEFVVEHTLAAYFGWLLRCHADGAPAGANLSAPTAPYPAAHDGSDAPEGLSTFQALTRLMAHLLHAALLPGVAVAAAWLLFDVSEVTRHSPLFIDDIDTRLFGPLMGVGALVLLAGGGYLVGRGVQRLADRFVLGSLQTEWRICQLAALAIALWALYTAGHALSARHINLYFSQDAGTPIRGEVVDTDSFIERPMNPSSCNGVPPARYYPPSPGPAVPRTVPTATHTRYVEAIDCSQGGARVSVRWTHSQDRSLLGTPGHALRTDPLPEAIPAGLCGRLKVGALGLRYVDELQGCTLP